MSTIMLVDDSRKLALLPLICINIDAYVFGKVRIVIVGVPMIAGTRDGGSATVPGKLAPNRFSEGMSP